MAERLFLYETPSQNMPGIEGFEIHRGINTVLASQIIKKSREPEIVFATPRDYQSRFTDIEALDSWLNEGRQIYPLVEMVGSDLAGIVWHGPKPFPAGGMYPISRQPADTFGIRLYEGFRGRRLAIPFMEYCLADYVTTVAENGRAGEFHGIWLSTQPERKKAYPLFKRFGYSEVARSDTEIIMVLLPDKIRDILRPESG